ncbi:MAG TPA: hypothetical protein VGN44_04850 [Candidatus Angelobacter sp.]
MNINSIPAPSVTGLGLWVSLEIVQKHKGRMKVRRGDSPGHHGTVFNVLVPHNAE